jgi:hypothetical protein
MCHRLACALTGIFEDAAHKRAADSGTNRGQLQGAKSWPHLLENARDFLT